MVEISAQVQNGQGRHHVALTTNAATHAFHLHDEAWSFRPFWEGTTMTLDEMKSVFREHVPGVSIEDDGPGTFTAVIRDSNGHAFPGAIKVTTEGAATLTLVEARALASNLHEAATE